MERIGSSARGKRRRLTGPHSSRTRRQDLLTSRSVESAGRALSKANDSSTVFGGPTERILKWEMAERLGDQRDIGSGNEIDGAFTPSAKKTIEY